MKKRRLPPGWDEERVRAVLAHSDQQSQEEAVAEDEAAFSDAGHTVMKIPHELVPAIRELIANNEKK